jgi:hypothetical protein
MIEIESGKDSNKTKFEKPNFLPFDIGQHRVRILGNPYKVWTHFLKGRATIRCLGSDCPICQNNKVLKAQNPDARNLPGYNSPSIRHYFNVLDRSMVKVCPSCGTENKMLMGSNDFTPMCKKCGTLIVQQSVVPSNKVKVINISDTTAEQLKNIQATTLDDKGEKIGLENFDVIFTSMMAGDRKNIFPQADKTANDKLEDLSEFMYDLEKIVISLEPDEIKNLMSGVSLKDIFIARRGETAVEEVSAELKAEIDETLGNLFNA